MDKIIFKKRSLGEPSQKLPGINVDQETYEEIVRIAQFSGVTQSEVIRTLVVESLKFVELKEV